MLTACRDDYHCRHAKAFCLQYDTRPEPLLSPAGTPIAGPFAERSTPVYERRPRLYRRSVTTVPQRLRAAARRYVSQARCVSLLWVQHRGNKRRWKRLKWNC